MWLYVNRKWNGPKNTASEYESEIGDYAGVNLLLGYVYGFAINYGIISCLPDHHIICSILKLGLCCQTL